MAALSFGVVQRPKAGNSVCGDTYVVVEEGPRVVVGVVDGLGSGCEARAAAELATAAVRRHHAEPVSQILHRCDEALRLTRGAAVGLVVLYPDERRLQYAGVGNVELRARRHPPGADHPGGAPGNRRRPAGFPRQGP